MNYISNKKIKDMTKKHLFQNGLAFLVCLFLFAGTLTAQTVKTKAVQVTSTGTWTVPTTLDGAAIKVTSVTFEAWGGGGAGGFTTGGHPLTDMYVSGGGGGGAYGKTVINDPAAGEAFTITVGAGGYNTADDDNSITCPFACFDNYRQADGGMSSVKRGSTTILEALGGKTCAGQDNTIGADGGAATGAGDLHYAGGKGGNASQDCTLAGRRSSGSGGGAAGPNGNGGNADNATCSANGGWKAGGTAGGGLAGKGGEGTSDHNDVLGGKPVGNPGINYGGGGAGSKTYRAWHSGGNGAPGVVLVTYTYVPTETIDITTDESGVAGTTNACDGTDFDIALNITVTGFDVSDATVELGTATTPAGVTLTGVNKNFTDGKWHVTGTAANTTSGTLTATIPVTVKTPSGNAQATANVTVNVYGKLNGGVIGVDQKVCQNQQIQVLTGDGTVVHDVENGYGDVTTALAAGGSGNGTYQWYMRDMLNSSSYEPIPGANTENYTPGNGYGRFKREYKDTECGTSAYATDADGFNFLYVVSVNPVELTPRYFSEDTICANSTYSHNISWGSESPAWEVTEPSSYWQKSTDKGATWENVKYVPGGVYSDYDIELTPADYNPGDDIWYRVAIKFWDCDSITSNGIHKVHVSEVPEYAPLEDINITLWYGACDTSLATIEAPALSDPTPVSVTRTDAVPERVGVGEYTLNWHVVVDDCTELDLAQKVIVEYPVCGTLTESHPTTDADGNEYQTIRIGCDCWLAENLRTNAGSAAYYNDDEANKAFGKLYDWNDAVGSNNTEKETMLGTTYIQGVCPEGWSIPTVAQYNKMMSNVEGTDAIKSDDQSTWLPGNAGTNAAGFAAMGAGYYEAMQYQRQLGYTYFWTADLNPSNNTMAKVMELRCGCDELTCTEKSKEAKVSVRCVRVEPVSVPL